MKTPKARHVYRSTSPLPKARVVAYQWSFLSENRARIEDLQSVALVRNAFSHGGESFPFPGSPAGSDSPLREDGGVGVDICTFVGVRTGKAWLWLAALVKKIEGGCRFAQVLTGSFFARWSDLR